MAKFQVGDGIDRYIDQLQNLEYNCREVIGEAIYVGAGLVADAVKANIKGLPPTAANGLEKAGLIDGFGIAKMRDENGYFNVKLGFTGYNKIKTKKYPGGQPNSVIARSIESGSSWRSSYPFVAPAVRATKDRAEQAMAEEIEKNIKSTMGV